ncbi:WD40 repeat domain-containing protein [Lewinella sp. 4G2]|uniref:WD40 repeat domain-containing protein n=1 Tax=Lewinella sp. 4G2 TaxID=1803372 RepID=UPI0007B4A906|nr:hypothetical protein [Lewinella sp. 4G2]OAV44350.1 hypothetical protein A3850_007510 [Lewinella sp. 4G2]
MLKRIAERNGHLGAIYDLEPAPDGFYSAAADGYIVHWHLQDVDFGQVVARVEGGKFFSLVTLASGGFVAGALDGGVHWLYPGNDDHNLHVAAHQRPVYAAVVVAGWLFTAGGDGVLIKWDLQQRRTVESSVLSPNSLRCITAGPDGTLLVGASDGYIYIVQQDSMEVLRKVYANQPSVFTVASVPGAAESTLISGGRDARLLIMELSGAAAQTVSVDAHLSTVNHLSFSPNGEYLATASRDKTVKLWRYNSGSLTLLKVAEVVRDRGHVNSVNTLLWLDDQTLITAGDDRRILEWRVG